MYNKHRYGKYGLLWQDIYELFQKIADRCFDEGPDMINKMVEEFFEEHKRDPLFQEAFHKWCDVEENYEEIAESRCINCSQSGKLCKNRLKDMVREGQLEGADAGEFMLDLIDSISDQKAKELCIDYGVPISEEDVESVTSASCITSASAPMAALEDIAKKYSDTIADRGGLQERGNDSEDFIELSVWTISAMLKAAYVLGQSSQSVESASTIFAASADSWPDENYWHELDDFDFEDAWSTYLCDLEDAVYDKYNIFAEPSVQGSIGSMFLFDNDEENDPIEISWMSWQANEIRLASSSSSAEEFQQKFDKYIARLIRKNGWTI